MNSLKIKNLKLKILRVIAFLLIFITGIYIFLRLTAESASAGWFDDTYSNRVKLSFVHNAALSDRAVTYTLDTAELISANLMQSDCDDIRFTDTNGKSLLYDLTGTCNNASTTFEVIFSSVISGSNVAYAYYGNSTALNNEINSTTFTALTPSGGDPPAQSSPTTVDEQGPSPVAYWSFDEGYGISTNDSIRSNSNNGTLSGSPLPVWYTEDQCRSANCLYFEGSSAYVTAGNGTSLQITDKLTISAWIRSNSFTFTHDIVSKFGASGNRSFRVYTDTSGFVNVAASSNGTGISGHTGTIPLTLNQWHHIVTTIEPGVEVKLYVDGRLDSSSTTVSSIFNSTANLEIGSENAGADNRYKGFIDEVKIYNFIKSAPQIKAEYTAKSQVKGATATFGDPDTKNLLSQGLVGYWKLDDNSGTASIDSSGNTNPGTLTGGPVWGIGKYGPGVIFDGTNDYISTFDIDYAATNPQFAISAWYKSTTCTGTSGECYIISKDQYDITSPYNLSVFDGGTDELNFCIQSTTCATYTSNTVLDGNWHHVVATLDNTTIQLYFDGILQATATNISPANNNGLMIIGGTNIDDTYRPFNGTIDEVRIYQRVLSATDTANLYTSAPSPVGHWKLDDNSGTSAIDSSTNSNIGTLTNSPTWTTGKYGSGITFAGNDQHIIRADDADFDFADDADMTLSTWFKHTTASAQEVILSKYNEAGYKIIMESDGNITCALDYDSTWTPTDSATSTNATYDDNLWHHIVCVKTGAASLTLYIDGVPIASDSSLTATNTLTNSDPIYFGIDANGTSNDFTGSLDDIKIYNYAHTSKQLLEDLNATHPTIGTPVGSYVAYWNFDETQGTTANDTSINTNTLTLNSTSWTTSGKYNSAWNGTGSTWLTRADDSDLDFAANEDFSISMWIKSDSTANPGGNEYILSKLESSAGYRIFYQSDGDLVFAIDDDATFTPDDSAGNLGVDRYDNLWHQLVAVKTGVTKIELYVDGLLIDSDTSIAATGTLANSIALFVGDRNGVDGGDEFNGDIDNLKIYRSALSASDVQIEFNRAAIALFGSSSTTSANVADNSQAREFCVPGDSSTCNPPVAWWKMDENTGTTALDYSGNSRNMPFTIGSPLWVAGKRGSGLYFPSAGDYTSYSSYQVAENAAFTISAWFKTNNTNASNIYAESNAAASQYAGLAVDVTTGNISGFINGSVGNGSINTSGVNYADNKWHQVSLVQASASSRTLYIDGAVAGTNSTNVGTLTLTQAAIGVFYDGTTASDSLIGTADNIILYDYARTAAQVAREYNRGDPSVWYKFDECQGLTSYNSAQNANEDAIGINGTITPGASGNTSAGACNSGTSTEMWNDGSVGKYTGSLGFDSTDDYITTTNTNIIDQNNDLQNGLTISAWIYPNSDGESDVGRIFTKNTNTWCRTDTDVGTTMDLQCSLDLSTDATINITSALTESTWNHIALSWTNDADDEITIWVNGKNVGSSTDGSGNASTDTANLIIGNDSTSGTATFDGQIDDFKIFNYELTSTQIKTLFNENSAVRFGP